MIKLNFRRGSAFASKKAKQYLETINPEDVKNITVIRHAAIGDFMNIRPFLINVREFFPNVKITLSVLRTAMYGIPYDLIDDVHIMDKDNPNDKTKKTSLFTRIKQAKELPPQDIIFDLTDSSLTLLLTIFAKAKLKIGYPYRSIRRIFYNIATLRSDFVIEAESTQHMLNILGSKQLSPLQYGFENTYPKNNIQKRIIYFAGASMQIKCWENKKFIELIDKLSDDYKEYQHIILQGIKEDEKFLDIYAPLKDKQNILLQTPMNLDDAMNFMANSSCVISNDTGVRNMAIAVETPTIGIFFATGAFRYWPRDGKHECVFNLEYLSPSVDEVYQTTNNLISRIYGK
jgi:ADP-heptose:LPS heptosyltransferase